MKIRVYYEDTDAGGIVYHANYLKYCERARSELFFEKGMKPFEDEGSGFVVRKIEADFLGSAMLGDILEIRTKILSQKRTSVVLSQKIERKNDIVFEMEVLLVYMKSGRIARIPQEFSELFDSLGKGL